MKPLLRNSFLWKLALLLAAIILFALSYIFNTIYTDTSSVKVEGASPKAICGISKGISICYFRILPSLFVSIQDKETQEEFKDVVKKNSECFSIQWMTMEAFRSTSGALSSSCRRPTLTRRAILKNTETPTMDIILLSNVRPG